jgi:Na+-transporting methylmalonyl-CoA/oxaloacetate decarboxylase gamma subunit
MWVPPVVAANMTLHLLGMGLVVLGLMLLVVTIILWRGAVADPEVLAPLEVMADRKFARADNVERVAILNLVRLEGSEHVDISRDAVALFREPVSEPIRPWHDPFPHDDDAVDIVPKAPAVIDPLLNNNRKDI